MGFMTQKMVESGMAARGFDVASGFDALTLKDYARWGLRDFNRFLPKCVLASLPLVEDQQDYDLPEACMTIAVVYYTPVRSDVTISRPSTFYYPSETYFWDAQFANFIAANRANYTVYDQGDGQLLRLFPVPTADTLSVITSVDYIYKAARAVTEVPEEWENILLDAISHRALLGMTTKDDGLIAFDDSGLKLRYGNNRTAWMAQALHFRREYIVAAKAKQLRFPSMRGARAGYGM